MKSPLTVMHLRSMLRGEGAKGNDHWHPVSSVSISLLPQSTAPKTLFRLVSQAYEKFSLIITTNKDFSGWAEIFEDQGQVTP